MGHYRRPQGTGYTTRGHRVHTLQGATGYTTRGHRAHCKGPVIHCKGPRVYCKGPVGTLQGASGTLQGGQWHTTRGPVVHYKGPVVHHKGPVHYKGPQGTLQGATGYTTRGHRVHYKGPQGTLQRATFLQVNSDTHFNPDISQQSNSSHRILIPSHRTEGRYFNMNCSSFPEKSLRCLITVQLINHCSLITISSGVDFCVSEVTFSV